jgi:hypothetical protein
METLYNGRKQVAKNSMVWDKRNKGSAREGSEAFNLVTRKGKGGGRGRNHHHILLILFLLYLKEDWVIWSEFQLPKS